jgi:hypothetical protein
VVLCSTGFNGVPCGESSDAPLDVPLADPAADAGFQGGVQHQIQVQVPGHRLSWPRFDRGWFRGVADLQGRPVYYRKRHSIEAHLTIVFAAFAVTRWTDSAGRICA